MVNKHDESDKHTQTNKNKKGDEKKKNKNKMGVNGQTQREAIFRVKYIIIIIITE